MDAAELTELEQELRGFPPEEVMSAIAAGPDRWDRLEHEPRPPARLTITSRVDEYKLLIPGSKVCFVLSEFGLRALRRDVLVWLRSRA